MTNNKRPSQLILTILKWFFSIIFFIAAMGATLEKSALAGIAFLLIALLLLPPLRNSWIRLVPFLEKRPLKFAVLFGLMAVAGAGVRLSNDGNKSFASSVKQYIEQNRGKEVALKNIDFIADCERAFNYTPGHDVSYDYMWQIGGNNLKQAYDSVNKEHYFLFTPDYYVGFNQGTGDTLISWKYLRPIAKYGVLINYYVKLVVDETGKVKKVYPVLVCKDYNANQINNLEITENSQDIDLSSFGLKKDIEAQNKLVADLKAEGKRNADAQAKRKEQTEKFKESCLSGWDGSCPPLVDYLKKNLKDPDSYEHIETGFWNMGDHAVVMTKYRAKNSFGGYMVGYIKAKVTWNCEMLEVTDAGNL